MTTIQISAEVEALLSEREREQRRMDRMALITALLDAEAAYRTWPTDHNWDAFCKASRDAWEAYPQK